LPKGIVYTCRDIAGRSVLTIARVGAGVQPGFAAAGEENMDPDRLYYNGIIYTVDPNAPAAAAIAVRAGRILAVGTEAQCRAALGRGFEPVDLKGRVMLPGFIDTHLHPIVMIYFELNVDLRGTASIAELIAGLCAMAAKSRPGEWVVGLHFDEQALAERRLPTRHELDAACGPRPAIVIKHDGHSVIANTAAIAAAGVTAATPDPPGGVIDREPDGYPAGPFRENAGALILAKLPVPELDAMAAGARQTFAKLTSQGITSVGAILQTGPEGPAGTSGALDIFATALLLPQIPLNLHTFLIATEAAQLDAAMKTPLHTAVPGGHRIAGIKIYADGTFGSCTALMHEPFSDQPDKSGFLVHSEDEIYRRMEFAHLAGLQVAIHAIGDQGNRVAVSLFERLLAAHPRPDHRHRLEHASILDPDTMTAIARLGLVVSTQPMFIPSEKHWLEKRLGPDRLQRTYPFRDIVDAGITLAGASDAPVESTAVLHAIQVCVTRDGLVPRQALTPAEAVRIFTINAAFAHHEDQLKGSITPGKRADLVILSANPADTRPDRIKDIEVIQTIVGGKVVWG
jgi:predicted amidohydrolase YtcJ